MRGINALAFAFNVFIAVDRHSHSGSDALYSIYPFCGVIFLGWDWLVRRLSKARA